MGNETAERTPAEQAPAQQDHVTYSPAQIRAIVSTMRATPAQLQEIAAALQLGPVEAAALLAGTSGLSMTPEQHARLVAYAARSSAEGVEEDGGPGCGDVCGCSGSPTPAPSGPRVPAITTTKTDIVDNDPGTTGHTGTVAGGTVTLRYGVDSQWPDGSNRKNRFAISYQGTDAENAHWLQFIWREIIGIHSDGSAHPLTSTITTTAANSYELTGGGTETTSGTPAKANYNTDSASATNPFYEAGFVGNRTADSTTMYDPPAAQQTKINEAFAAGAVRVVSRAHFHTFLIQRDVVTYKVGINIIWTVASATSRPVQSETVGDCGAASALPTLMRERLHEQYPAYNFIR